MTTIREGLLEELRARDAHHNAGPSNPPFIAADDLGGEGYSRAAREVARFSTFSHTIVRESQPFQPDQASVKVPRLSWVTRKGENHAETERVVESGWFLTEYVVSGTVTLSPQRPSKFRGKPNLDCPSQKLAAFMQGKGEAWGWRDEDVHMLLLAWANAVQPSATDARRASACLALAIAARAGIAVTSTSHLPF
jgi:hypothetical protein